MAASVRNIASGGASAMPGVIYMQVQYHTTTRLKRFHLKQSMYPRPIYVLGATWFFSQYFLLGLDFSGSLEKYLCVDGSSKRTVSSSTIMFGATHFLILTIDV